MGAVGGLGECGIVGGGGNVGVGEGDCGGSALRHIGTSCTIFKAILKNPQDNGF